MCAKVRQVLQGCYKICQRFQLWKSFTFDVWAIFNMNISVHSLYAKCTMIWAHPPQLLWILVIQHFQFIRLHTISLGDLHVCSMLGETFEPLVSYPCHLTHILRLLLITFCLHCPVSFAIAVPKLSYGQPRHKVGFPIAKPHSFSYQSWLASLPQIWQIQEATGSEKHIICVRVRG